MSDREGNSFNSMVTTSAVIGSFGDCIFIFYFRSFVYLTSHLAKAGVYNLDNIDAIFLEANKCDMTDL